MAASEEEGSLGEMMDGLDDGSEGGAGARTDGGHRQPPHEVEGRPPRQHRPPGPDAAAGEEDGGLAAYGLWTPPESPGA